MFSHSQAACMFSSLSRCFDSPSQCSKNNTTKDENRTQRTRGAASRSATSQSIKWKALNQQSKPSGLPWRRKRDVQTIAPREPCKAGTRGRASPPLSKKIGTLRIGSLLFRNMHNGPKKILAWRQLFNFPERGEIFKIVLCSKCCCRAHVFKN